MTTSLLLIAVICIPSLGWLVLHFAKQATKERERADYNEAVAKETKRQADNIGAVRTDDDVLNSLRKKAADKRDGETKRKR
jgi:hypothetical protein